MLFVYHSYEVHKIHNIIQLSVYAEIMTTTLLTPCTYSVFCVYVCVCVCVCVCEREREREKRIRTIDSCYCLYVFICYLFSYFSQNFAINRIEQKLRSKIKL